jgi:hypothetical protein
MATVEPTCLGHLGACSFTTKSCNSQSSGNSLGSIQFLFLLQKVCLELFLSKKKYFLPNKPAFCLTTYHIDHRPHQMTDFSIVCIVLKR